MMKISRSNSLPTGHSIALFSFILIALLFVILVLAAEGEEILTGWNKTFNGNGTGFSTFTLSADIDYDIAIDNSSNVYVGGIGGGLFSTTVANANSWWIKKYFPNATEDTTWDIMLYQYCFLYAIDSDSKNNL